MRPHTVPWISHCSRDSGCLCNQRRRQDLNPGGLLEADGDLDRRLRYRVPPRRASYPLAVLLNYPPAR
ncbi:hypothetical protein T01_665 [Trichinella spiralis]|uniref:Uncharacterized protein n=1 Tax=Trichinella spiralis TaxID=6334 RepID=A0A0V1AUW4_TRISP|nr:hypothetical protein T01_15970 [Trichinella spiralis]KRY28562.1 hypothetical protein T01_665 [Trichinella spiralis]